jgi:hypothetical protein
MAKAVGLPSWRALETARNAKPKAINKKKSPGGKMSAETACRNIDALSQPASSMAMLA